MGTDCKSVGSDLRWFKSSSAQKIIYDYSMRSHYFMRVVSFLGIDAAHTSYKRKDNNSYLLVYFQIKELLRKKCAKLLSFPSHRINLNQFNRKNTSLLKSNILKAYFCFPKFGILCFLCPLSSILISLC